jgi:ubiquinone/menaquinone biosynthesis C-methylase UbiE
MGDQEHARREAASSSAGDGLAQRLRVLLPDPRFRSLLAHHLAAPAPADVTLAEEVWKLAPQDQFAISQYLVGRKYFERRIAAAFGSGKVLVDVGCGAGNWSIGASEYFDRVTGIDIHEPRLAVAAAITRQLGLEGRVVYVKASAADIPLAAGSADAVLCYNVLAIMDMDLDLVFGEFRRLVKPGGRLYVTATEPGYLLYLLVATLLAPSFPKLLSQFSVFQRNTRYLLRMRPQPYAYLGEKLLVSSAARQKWGLIHSGVDGWIVGQGYPSLFRPTYGGLSFMREYLFVAA